MTDSRDASKDFRFPRTLRERFDELKQTRSFQRRGAEFEALIFEVLSDAGLKPKRNARVATPRQTDLFVTWNKTDIIFEVKWQSRKIDVSDIAAMRDRLRRTPSDIIGLILSMSEFTEGAISEIRQDRSREILLINPQECERLLSAELNVAQLIQRKREALRRDAKVWFHQKKARARLARLPVIDRKLYDEGGERHSIFGLCDNSEISYSLQLPDTSWHSFHTPGVALDIRLDVNTQDDLETILEVMHQRFGLTKEGTFAIEQTEGCWFGVGAAEFMTEVRERDRRYAECNLQQFHHSEGLVYFDSLRDGWFTLIARQDARTTGRRNLIDSGELYIQLPGIPVDPTEFVDLCREFRDSAARFYTANSPTTYQTRLLEPKELKVQAKMLEPSSGWVGALIVLNPFYKCRKLPKELSQDNTHTPLRLINSTELLICDLDDWLAPETTVDAFDLTHIEGMWTGHKAVIHARGTWRNEIKKSNKTLRRRSSRA